MTKANQHVFKMANGAPRKYSPAGSYPIIYLISGHDRNGPTLHSYCPECALAAAEDPEEEREIRGDLHMEGSPLECDQCGIMISSAYGEPD